MATTIFRSLQKANASNLPTTTQRRLSPLQSSQIDRFKRMFPFEENVLGFFSPTKWSASLKHSDKSLLCPAVTLNLVDTMYHEPIAEQIVYNNLVGLFSIAKPNEPINQQSCRLAASMFVARLGQELCLFGMLHYFASYLTDYKTTYSQLDLQDVMRQCAKAYLPRWRDRLGAAERKAEPAEPEKPAEEGKITGQAALFQYLRDEYVANGWDLHLTVFYRTGRLTEDDIAYIESGEPLLL